MSDTDKSESSTGGVLEHDRPTVRVSTRVLAESAGGRTRERQLVQDQLKRVRKLKSTHEREQQRLSHKQLDELQQQHRTFAASQRAAVKDIRSSLAKLSQSHANAIAEQVRHFSYPFSFFFFSLI